MLARIPDQQHPILRSKTGKKLAHLVGGGQARLVDKIEMLLLWGRRRDRPGEKSLQRSGLDAGLAKLPRGAGCWGKALDLEPLRFRSAADNRKRCGLARSGKALDALNTVWRTQHILNDAPLSAVEMLILIDNKDCLRS